MSRTERPARMSRDQRRNQLLDVAAELFADSSFSGVTTSMLARKAGVTEPVIYQHFSGKDELYHEVLREGCRRTIEEWEKIAAERKSPLNAVIGIARAQFHLSELWVYYKIHVRAISESGDKDVAKILTENYEQYHQFLSDLLKQAQEATEIAKTVRVSDIAWFLLSQGLMINVSKQINMPKLEDSGYIEHFMVQGVLFGLAQGNKTALSGK